MFRFHSLMFTSKLSFLNWIGELLIILDASTSVLTLGVVEMNLSTLWYQILERKYPEAFVRDNRDNW